MNLSTIDANRIKFEARTAPLPDPPKTGSAFGRFLRSFGALTAPIGFASSLFFPPAAVVGAAAYGLGQYGGYRDQAKRQSQMPAPTPGVYFPAVTTPAGGPVPPSTQTTIDPINVIADRQAATNQMIGEVR